MDMPDLIAKANDAVARVASGVRPDQLSSPTPCSDYTVGELANHVAGFYAGTARAARKQGADDGHSGAGPGDLIGTNPGAVLSDLGQKASAAWSTPGALEGMTKFGPGDIPAEMAAAITLFETLAHGWDLAKGTGQDLEVSQELAEASLTVANQGWMEGGRANGRFGPAVPAPAGAGPWEQALAMSGRDPGWSG